LTSIKYSPEDKYFEGERIALEAYDVLHAKHESFIKRRQWYKSVCQELLNMKKIHLPYLALALGLLFMVIIQIGSAVNAEGITRIPLLSMLIMNEFAFFLSAAATYVGINHIKTIGFNTAYTLIVAACMVLTLRFMILGIQLWPL